MKKTFSKVFPYLHLYCELHGQMEIGQDEHSDSWVRLLDEGGTQEEFDLDSLDDSLAAAEEWAEEWMGENYADEVEGM